MSTSPLTYPLQRPRAFTTIFCGGLIAAILDVLDATVANHFMGNGALHVLQRIASGVLGASAFQGGLPTAVLGLLFHLFIAFTVASVYYVASIVMPTLIRRAPVWGAVYGLAVYFFMQLIVLPLSATPKSPMSMAMVINGMIGHALFVGLPIALLARSSSNFSPPSANSQCSFPWVRYHWPFAS